MRAHEIDANAMKGQFALNKQLIVNDVANAAKTSPPGRRSRNDLCARALKTVIASVSVSLRNTQVCTSPYGNRALSATRSNARVVKHAVKPLAALTKTCGSKFQRSGKRLGEVWSYAVPMTTTSLSAALTHNAMTGSVNVSGAETSKDFGLTTRAPNTKNPKTCAVHVARNTMYSRTRANITRAERTACAKAASDGAANMMSDAHRAASLALFIDTPTCAS